MDLAREGEWAPAAEVWLSGEDLAGDLAGDGAGDSAGITACQSPRG
jgi:hypothetical protein